MAQFTEKTPIPDSYWLVPQRLLAGEYPGSFEPSDLLRKLKAFLAAGVTFFVDLTEDGELRPYVSTLVQEAKTMGVAVLHRRFAIKDGGIPSIELMREVLATIAGAIADGHIVYFHCYGGIGRTGTVAGCWLVEQGMTPAEALTKLSYLRKDCPDGGIRSPENDIQKRFVEKWRSNHEEK